MDKKNISPRVAAVFDSAEWAAFVRTGREPGASALRGPGSGLHSGPRGVRGPGPAGCDPSRKGKAAT